MVVGGRLGNSRVRRISNRQKGKGSYRYSIVQEAGKAVEHERGRVVKQFSEENLLIQ